MGDVYLSRHKVVLPVRMTYARMAARHGRAYRGPNAVEKTMKRWACRKALQLGRMGAFYEGGLTVRQVQDPFTLVTTVAVIFYILTPGPQDPSAYYEVASTL